MSSIHNFKYFLQIELILVYYFNQKKNFLVYDYHNNYMRYYKNLKYENTDLILIVLVSLCLGTLSFRIEKHIKTMIHYFTLTSRISYTIIIRRFLKYTFKFGLMDVGNNLVKQFVYLCN